MSAAYRTGSAATVVRAVIAVVAGILFATQVLAIVTDTDRWNYGGDGLKVSLVIGCVSYLVLAVIAVVALVARRLPLDLLLLAASGWAIAWSAGTGPAAIPYLIDASNADYGRPKWSDWLSAGMGLVLALVSAAHLAGLISATSGLSGPSGGSSGISSGATGLSPSIPAGWHADPSGVPRQERWWDGSTWTDHVRDAR